MIKAVLLAGGIGSRLWPMSRSDHPKQFLKLFSDETLLQSSIRRLSGLDISSSVTICNEDHRFFVAEQLREIDKLGEIILEPVGRNTAPAIALAALTADDDPLLLVMPADHIIKDELAFKAAIYEGIPLAKSDKLVTFGIVPNKPHTGYGYIKTGRKCEGGFIVDRFVEKPSIELAHEYVESKNYLWNSGIFLFKASRFLDELKKFRPDIYKACQASVVDAKLDLDFLRVDHDKFFSCPSESIDYAVMEKTDDAVVVPMNALWSDIGSWTSLWDVSVKDTNSNVSYGDVKLHNSKNCYVRAENKLVTLVGAQDLVIVDTKDALMVAHKESTQDVKIILQKLKSSNRSECDSNREVYRPWGKYDSIDSGDAFKIKRITVKPGEKLSLQKHHHRAEHWIVVSGTARVTNGEKVFILHKDKSTYIPVGAIHSLENPGLDDLELVEVQTGSYLGEDDIVRFEDKYGRVK